MLGLLLLGILCFVHGDENAPVVETKVGTIIGRYHHVEVFGKQLTVERYLGIPYAEPPVGDLRFRKPIPLKSFGSPFKAFDYGNACYQMNISPIVREDIPISEDCLVLNVYVPAVREEKELAVMIWIHGGGFVAGAAHPYVSDVLAAHGKVIVVTIQYRISVWGFLTTGDDIAPGNYGLFDQHLAIKWVHDNIKKFGGDPQRVTLFGHSAGGGSVVFQSTFEGNIGLFQRAIAQSGSVNTLWASFDEGRKDSVALGKLVGCEDTTSSRLVECISKVPAELLSSVINNVSNDFLRFPCPFVPVFDGNFIKTSPKDIFDLNSDGEVLAGLEFFSSLDFLTGVVAAEGTVLIGPFVGIQDPMRFEPSREFFEKELVPKALCNLYGHDVPHIVKDLIVHEYTDWECPDSAEKIRYKILQIYTELVFSVPMLETIGYHATSIKPQKGSFMYMFDIKPSETFLPTPSWVKDANHGDELEYLFFDEAGGVINFLPGRDSYRPQEWESDIADYMITIWSNFAQTG